MRITSYIFTSLSVILALSCEKECTIIDWSGNYLGKDNIIKTTEGGTPLTEPPVTATVEINPHSGPMPEGANLGLKISLLFNSSAPQIIQLFGVATCKDTFQIYDKLNVDSTLVDANGRYKLEYIGGIASYINDSQDVQLLFIEKKTYDNQDLQNLNYNANHTIQLNKQ